MWSAWTWIGAGQNSQPWTHNFHCWSNSIQNTCCCTITLFTSGAVTRVRVAAKLRILGQTLTKLNYSRLRSSAHEPWYNQKHLLDWAFLECGPDPSQILTRHGNTSFLFNKDTMFVSPETSQAPEELRQTASRKKKCIRNIRFIVRRQ
jgi:hypothetical protein